MKIDWEKRSLWGLCFLGASSSFGGVRLWSGLTGKGSSEGLSWLWLWIEQPWRISCEPAALAKVVKAETFGASGLELQTKAFCLSPLQFRQLFSNPQLRQIGWDFYLSLVKSKALLGSAFFKCIFLPKFIELNFLIQ